MKPSDKYEATLDKALEAVTIATSHQIWTDVNTRPTNEVADVLRAVIDTLRAAAAEYDTDDDNWFAKAYTMQDAAEIVVTLYCRSVRTYDEAREWVDVFC